MSMLCSIHRITPEQAARLEQYPDAIGDLLGCTQPPHKPGFLSRLFGKAPVTPPAPQKLEPIAAMDTFELDQAWHILHFLFSGGNAEGPWPAAFLMSGGEEIGPDRGYGPVRLFSPALSRDVAAFLDALSFKALEAAYIPDEIEATEIYWRASSEPRERQRQVEELWDRVTTLQAFFGATVQAGNATLVSIY